MWAGLVMLPRRRSYSPSQSVETLWAVGTHGPTLCTTIQSSHTARAARGDYSAHNSWRACSTRSRNVRSRDIWRLTLSTLWMTVE